MPIRAAIDSRAVALPSVAQTASVCDSWPFGSPSSRSPTRPAACPFRGRASKLGILSEATRSVLASGGGVRQLTDLLQQRREGKDRASVLGLLAALDSLFGDPVFQARIARSPAALPKGRTRLDLTKLVEAQVLCCDTLVRWLFTFLVQQGPAPNRHARAAQRSQRFGSPVKRSSRTPQACAACGSRPTRLSSPSPRRRSRRKSAGQSPLQRPRRKPPSNHHRRSQRRASRRNGTA